MDVRIIENGKGAQICAVEEVADGNYKIIEEVLSAESVRELRNKIVRCNEAFWHPPIKIK